MVMVRTWWMRMDTPSGALYPSPHQRSRRRPKLIMRPITSAAFSAAFAVASAAFAFASLHAEFGIRELTQRARYANNSRIYFGALPALPEYVHRPPRPTSCRNCCTGALLGGAERVRAARPRHRAAPDGDALPRVGRLGARFHPGQR